MQYDISIIIASWNVRDLLRDCLHSIIKSKHACSIQIIVVDNASHDGSADMVAQEFPEVLLIANKKNNGFAKACNQGSEKATGKYLLFLNDDTVMHDATLDSCIAYFEQHKNIGVLGCSLKNNDGSQQESVRRLPTVFDMTVLLLKAHRAFPQLLNRYIMKKFDYSRTQTVGQVMGAFFLTTREVFDMLHGFDNGYYFWFEEVDFCTRVLERGMKTVYFAGASILHYKGQSIKQLNALPEQMIFNKVVRRYFHLHRPLWQYYWIAFLSWLTLPLAGLVGILEKLRLKAK